MVQLVPILALACVLSLNFEKDDPRIKLFHGARRVDGALEFNTGLQYAEMEFSRQLDGVKAVSIGGWFFPRRSGEQYFMSRGVPEIGALGERFFRPTNNWVNFVMGTDQRGFLMGTINGNGLMPFVHVTVNEVAFDAWNQLVLIKDTNGFQKFYINGTLVHTDRNAISAGKIWPFNDTASGEPLRLAIPLGGRIGEVWICSRELSAEEIKRDFESNRAKYKPAVPGTPVQLREMNAHPPTAPHRSRQEILHGAKQILGTFPTDQVPLEAKLIGEEDCGSYTRRKISIRVQENDRMPAWLLVPKNLKGRVPAIICFYGTTSGAGKDTTVGLSGRAPGSPPHPNLSFAIDMVQAGFVAFAPDYLRDGERIKPGRRPYDTTDFYEEYPDWSIHGKDIWDTSRAIDYLETLELVDSQRIGMVGHSYGGHSTIFAAAMEPRVKVAVANGPVSDFLHHGLHWAVPKGGGNSQSMPALRPYVLDHTLPLPVTFAEFTSLIAPRPLLVGQAAGERRPMEEENYAHVRQAYGSNVERVRYHWYAGDHDFPPEARAAAVEWFKKWFKAE
jgi:dienelactone hydrolase